MNYADINGDLRLDMICDHGDGTHSAKLANEDFTYQKEFTLKFEGGNGKFCGTGKTT